MAADTPVLSTEQYAEILRIAKDWAQGPESFITTQLSVGLLAAESRVRETAHIGWLVWDTDEAFPYRKEIYKSHIAAQRASAALSSTEPGRYEVRRVLVECQNSNKPFDFSRARSSSGGTPTEPTDG